MDEKQQSTSQSKTSSSQPSSSAISVPSPKAHSSSSSGFASVLDSILSQQKSEVSTDSMKWADEHGIGNIPCSAFFSFVSFFASSHLGKPKRPYRSCQAVVDQPANRSL
jgi:hypothetical protein